MDAQVDQRAISLLDVLSESDHLYSHGGGLLLTPRPARLGLGHGLGRMRVVKDLVRVRGSDPGSGPGTRVRVQVRAGVGSTVAHLLDRLETLTGWPSSSFSSAGPTGLDWTWLGLTRTCISDCPRAFILFSIYPCWIRVTGALWPAAQTPNARLNEWIASMCMRMRGCM